MKKFCVLVFTFLALFTACDYNFEEKNESKNGGLKSISVTKQPDKLSYYEGEVFNPAGMEVTAAFSDGTKKIVTDYEYSPKTPLDVLVQNISVSYTYGSVKKSTSVAITVQQGILLESIYIASAPEKTEYVEGDLFDSTGLEVYAKYIDGSEKKITDYTYSPDAELSAEIEKIIISYTEGAVTKTAEVAITVSPAQIVLDSIEVSRGPDKVRYFEGEKFDPSGMIVTAKFSDGSEAAVKGYVCTPKDGLTTEITQIEISYTRGGVTKTTQISITVDSKVSVDIDYETAKSNYGTSYEISGGEYSVAGNVVTLIPDAEKIEYKISGYFEGQIINNTKNTILTLNGAYLENKSGKPVILSTKKIELSAKKDSVNYIVASGTSSEKTAAVLCYDEVEDKSKDLELGGAGTAYIVGNVYHGIKADEVKAKGNGKYYVQGTAKGAAINCKTFLIEEEKTVSLYLLNSKNGIKADENITVLSGNLYFASVATALKTDTSADDKADKPKEHFIKLSDCNIFTNSIDVLYKTESDDYYSAENVTIEEF